MLVVQRAIKRIDKHIGEENMKRIFGWLYQILIAAAVVALPALASTCSVCAQSPLFPNTRPVYNDPYGVPSANPNGPFYRGGTFTLQPLPAIYAQPLPAPPPFVTSGFGSVPYYYVGGSDVLVFGGTSTYPPPRNPNWAPNFSSR